MFFKKLFDQLSGVPRNTPAMLGSVVAVVVAIIGLPVDAQENEIALPERTSVKLMLDFTPNTNHTGFYVAQAEGYYDVLNLDVEILEPADVLAEQAVSTGVVEFGIGFQEFTTFAIVDGADVVSIAAIIQSNTSGFATVAADDPIETAADLAMLTYGGFSFPSLENAMISTLLACDGAEWDEANYLDVGFADPIELLTRDRIDYSWIFYGWQGIGAEVRDIELDVLFLADYPDCVPDYYTPILLTSSEMIEQNPDVVLAFTQATAQGYQFAIENPDEAATILLDAVPELDEVLVRESAAWLAPRYQGEAAQWGQQELDIWQGFTDFLVENEIIPADAIDVEAVFTNAFLPE